MTTYSYIQLGSDDPSGTMLKFKVIQAQPILERTDELGRTISGTLDKSAGAIIRTHQYLIRVPMGTPESGYGNYSDLETLFRLNNPNSIPSDTITLIDHYGNSFDCKFTGTLSPEMATTVLEGSGAFYYVQIGLMEIDPL